MNVNPDDAEFQKHLYDACLYLSKRDAKLIPDFSTKDQKDERRRKYKHPEKLSHSGQITYLCIIESLKLGKYI